MLGVGYAHRHLRLEEESEESGYAIEAGKFDGATWDELSYTKVALGSLAVSTCLSISTLLTLRRAGLGATPIAVLGQLTAPCLVIGTSLYIGEALIEKKDGLWGKRAERSAYAIVGMLTAGAVTWAGAAHPSLTLVAQTVVITGITYYVCQISRSNVLVEERGIGKRGHKGPLIDWEMGTLGTTLLMSVGLLTSRWKHTGLWKGMQSTASTLTQGALCALTGVGIALGNLPQDDTDAFGSG